MKMKKYKSYEHFLKDLEDATGYQVYDERTDSEGVKTPYIVCGRITNQDFLADNTIYLKRDMVNVLLFTVQSNHVKSGQRTKAEKKVEEYLSANGYLWDRDSDWLENAELHQTTYGIEVWYEQ